MMIDSVILSLLQRIKLRRVAIPLALLAPAFGGCGEEGPSMECSQPGDAGVAADATCHVEPAGQICNRETMTCQRICLSSEYLFVCQGDGFDLRPSAAEPPTGCRIARIVGSGAARETMNCCPCGA